MRRLKQSFRRPLHMRFVDAYAIAVCGERPKLYRDRNSRGKTYYRLIYYERVAPNSQPVQKSIYLAYLDPLSLQSLSRALANNAAERAAKKEAAKRFQSQRERIRVIREVFKAAKRLAHQAARHSDLEFMGFELRRKRAS